MAYFFEMNNKFFILATFMLLGLFMSSLEKIGMFIGPYLFIFINVRTYLSSSHVAKNKQYARDIFGWV